MSIPPAVAAAAAGRELTLVWQNEAGGMTYQIGTGSARTFVKWVPAGSGLDLGAEAVRMAWAGTYVSVPRVLAAGEDAAGAWLLTAGLAGESAVSERWKADPATAVKGIGRGLRAFHDSLPVNGCPFSWSAQERLEVAERRRADRGESWQRSWHPDHSCLRIAEALAILKDIPPPDRLAVCQADACTPNTLLDADGECSGHVDLGDLGVADRWADLAIATWSATWNYGPGWEGPLLSAYGVDTDPVRTRYYRLLWDLSS